MKEINNVQSKEEWLGKIVGKKKARYMRDAENYDW